MQARWRPREGVYMEVTDNPGGIAAISPSGAAPQRHVSLFEQININAFWIANNFHWQALLAIVIPSMVVKFLGDANKDVNLALVVIWGTLVAVVVNPLIGAISDYATFRMGRRRPFLIAGTVFNVVVLVLFAFAPRWFSSTALLVFFYCSTHYVYHIISPVTVYQQHREFSLERNHRRQRTGTSTWPHCWVLWSLYATWYDSRVGGCWHHRQQE